MRCATEVPARVKNAAIASAMVSIERRLVARCLAAAAEMTR
jgi:hypothetical protein